MDCDINETTSSLQEVRNFTGNDSEHTILKGVRNVFYDYGLPIVCLFGIVGNMLNLAILTRRKLKRSYRTVEQAANVCLIGLALSDLLFCTFAFPTTFLPRDGKYQRKNFILYYGMYSTAFINVFIMASTWMTVTMATERYIAICHPLNQKLFMTLRKTKLIIVIVYIVAFAFNVPVLWRYKIEEKCIINSTDFIYRLDSVPLGNDALKDNVYRILWAIVGNFIPLVLLIGFNIKICWRVHKSYKYRQRFQVKHRERTDSSNTLTITLITIVVMFFILVAPSEIVLFFIAGIRRDENNRDLLNAIEATMNFMQTVNFSVNFALYCIISPYFRRTLRYMFCCHWYHTRRQSYKLSMSESNYHMPLKKMSGLLR
ncbi:probable G-protein coupled receptor B0563.6 [Mytilus californianus]|uniref:probable G-protein coupled receptor B0563.6 n=1 Tax=Mytilus californianus TaxID=6549 RepID=UPI002246E428|nr:probable G-protein coupled receptor B0563.6 [Mytilus californianus]